MTPEFKRRINVAIEECDRYINLESPRSADLRPPEITKRLNDYIAHRAKLVRMLMTAMSWKTLGQKAEQS